MGSHGLAGLITGAAVAVALSSDPAAARFLTTDAEEIDPEERLNTETYNDILSYRFPLAWDRRWDGADVGFRAHAGSLNVNRFHYVEDIKFHSWLSTPDQEIPVFSFERHREEDFLEQRVEQEVRLAGNPLPHINLAMMADGGTFKQFGDVGFALGLVPYRRRRVEIYWWSVDHYYATKKDHPEDDRSRNPETFGARWDWNLGTGNGLRLAGRYEWDHPVHWNRRSRGYRYEYWRRTLATRLEVGDPEGSLWYGAGEFEHKGESRSHLAGEAVTVAKGMTRKVAVLDLGRETRLDGRDLALGVLFVSRDMQGSFAADPGLPEEAYPENPGPTYSRRREIAVHGKTQERRADFAVPLYGIQANHVRIDEGGSERLGEEVKFQAALQMNLAPNTSILLNTTWDLDEVWRDFPYGEEPFRPWGGGDIQFLAVF